MPRCIASVEDGGKRYYLLWSTIVDAPVSFGMELEEFQGFMKEEYGNQGWPWMNESFKMVNETGCSFNGYTFDELIAHNRAGVKEATLTREEIIDWYCRKREDPH